MSLLDALRRLLFGEADGVRRAAPASADALRHERARRGGPASAAAVAGDRTRVEAAGLPWLADFDALAAWLGLALRELDWLSDPARLARAPHYQAHVRVRADGRPRVLLAPLPRLKGVQRLILRELLDRVDPGEHAHGFVRGRSIVSNARAHAGKAIVVRFDVEGFFHCFSYKQVVGLFRALGFPLEVARRLGLLTTAPTLPHLAELTGKDPRRVRSDDPLRRALSHRGRGSLYPILPQGAPTSPAIANLLCRRLDRRLAGLARRFEATYTRYADDLVFSGNAELRRAMRRFVPRVRRILRSEGLPESAGKHRVARAGSRQVVTGLVVNTRPNVPAREVRQLRAILFNCARHGPRSQNRTGHRDFRAHLGGRIAHVSAANFERGARLREAFERIDWDELRTGG